MKQMLQICCKNNNIYKEFPIGSSLLDISLSGSQCQGE